MKTDFLDLTSKVFRQILLTGAILYIVVYIFIVFSRIQYPFGLEWQEGDYLEDVRRILSGGKLYVSPSLEFIPYVYTPLYFYLSAAVSIITGDGFMPMRLVSFISSLGSFVIIFLIVKKETGSNFSGILATSLFVATYKLSNSWFDLGRVDSLFLFFLLTALYLIKFKTSLKSLILSGIFISLSFLTKQTALMISLPIILYCILLERRSSIFFIGTIVAIIGGSTIILNYLHNGWYNFYVFDLLSHQALDISYFINFWKEDISPLSIASSVSIFYILVQLSDSNKKNCLFYFLTAIGILGSAWYSRLHSGGAANVLIPAYAFISILFGLGVHAFFEFIQNVPADKRNLLKIFIYLVCILQFTSGSLMYNPFNEIPTQKDVEAGRKFVNKLAQIKGEIFFPEYNHLLTLAGKNRYVHFSPMIDIFRTIDWQQFKAKVINEVKQAIQEKRFSALIIDSKEQRKFYNTLVQIKNESSAPSTAYLPAQAGKNSHAHKRSIGDAFRTIDMKQVKAKLSNELKQAIQEKRFSALIIYYEERWYRLDIEKYYIKQGPVFDSKDAFWRPVKGPLKLRPQFIYVPKSNGTY